MSRRLEVLRRLRPAPGAWVETPDLSSALVGGSEGTRRLRELRAQGWRIEARPHPEPGRTSWQYRLVAERPGEPEQATLWEDEP